VPGVTPRTSRRRPQTVHRPACPRHSRAADEARTASRIADEGAGKQRRGGKVCGTRRGLRQRAGIAGLTGEAAEKKRGDRGRRSIGRVHSYVFLGSLICVGVDLLRLGDLIY
jgi:hypothetical protein